MGVVENAVAFWRAWAARARYEGPRRDRRRAERARAEAALLRAFGRDRRRADDVASREARRRPQLGLSLLLAARRGVHGARALRARLRRGGATRSSTGCFTRRASRVPSFASSTTSSASSRGGARARPPRGLRRRAPGAHRKRRDGQLQLDLYGEVIDAVAQLVSRRSRPDGASRDAPRSRRVRRREHWREPDQGIWEPRSGREHHVHSRVLCWVALDRLLGARGARPDPRLGGAVASASSARAAIAAEVRCARLIRARSAATSPTLGGEELDATLLLLSWYGFEERVGAAHGVDGLARRSQRSASATGSCVETSRSPDDGGFVACAFWAVGAPRARRRHVDEARARFEDAARASPRPTRPLRRDRRSGTARHLGNYPAGLQSPRADQRRAVDSSEGGRRGDERRSCGCFGDSSRRSCSRRSCPASQGLGLTRMNIPFMLGTMFRERLALAARVGFLVHLVNGWSSRSLYVAAFHVWGGATWWRGVAIGLVHSVFVLAARDAGPPCVASAHGDAGRRARPHVADARAARLLRAPLRSTDSVSVVARAPRLRRDPRRVLSSELTDRQRRAGQCGHRGQREHRGAADAEPRPFLRARVESTVRALVARERGKEVVRSHGGDGLVRHLRVDAVPRELAVCDRRGDALRGINAFSVGHRRFLASRVQRRVDDRPRGDLRLEDRGDGLRASRHARSRPVELRRVHRRQLDHRDVYVALLVEQLVRSDSVKPFTACFAAQYAACSGIARYASAEPTCTITPRPRGFIRRSAASVPQT